MLKLRPLEVAVVSSGGHLKGVALGDQRKVLQRTPSRAAARAEGFRSIYCPFLVQAPEAPRAGKRACGPRWWQRPPANSSWEMTAGDSTRAFLGKCQNRFTRLVFCLKLGELHDKTVACITGEQKAVTLCAGNQSLKGRPRRRVDSACQRLALASRGRELMRRQRVGTTGGIEHHVGRFDLPRAAKRKPSPDL